MMLFSRSANNDQENLVNSNRSNKSRNKKKKKSYLFSTCFGGATDNDHHDGPDTLSRNDQHSISRFFPLQHFNSNPRDGVLDGQPSNSGKPLSYDEPSNMSSTVYSEWL